ncbi:MAG: ABC transporter ATP-binding protein [Eubacteriales bacterium]|nr:ABC transporter ATP-binding protein [Eubacteriales bacterium]
MIDVENVTKRYGGVTALSGVNLRVERGQVLGLLGQNGAGKTTLLNILTGYLAPTSGRALLDGHDVLLEPEAAMRCLGYLPEKPPLYDEMTVEEYLRFAAELKQVVRRAIPGHVEEIMKNTGLTAMRERLLGHLSKGYRQRVGMAQALCGDPDVLVLDEPTVGLDPKQITEIRGLIQRLGKSHTILFSSHILSEVQQLCDRVVILHRGKVKLDSAIGDVSGESGVVVECAALAGEKKLTAAVAHLPGVQSVTVLPASSAEETRLCVSFAPGGLPEKALFTLCSGLGAPLTHLSRREGGLEAAFLRCIEED